VKDVAPLLGRTEQTVCDFSRNARLGLQQGDDVGELIERARQRGPLSRSILTM